ncbi:MAG: PolC-type DNA polymerase III [Bacilli bacterium]|jgi:DNA polymerase-3 subunit alpha (Gram-positive type)|nr:PolC-type DNA polymerase III [Bacilli bacterium]MCH4235456.1 PolC-type DNA polymerase III [Bacilli bacterium]
MDKTMDRFLNSLGLDSAEGFEDLDFLKINKEADDSWVFVIEKKEPWDYVPLQNFINGLANIKYSYQLFFKYQNEPTIDEAIKLFYEWYASIYHASCAFKVDKSFDGMIEFVFMSQMEEDNYRSILSDFKSFLSFINYDFPVFTRLSPLESEAPSQIESKAINEDISAVDEEEKLEIAIDNDESVFPSDDEEPLEDKFTSIHKLIAEEHEAEQAESEKILLEEAKENKKRMEEDRRHARSFHRGDYRVMNIGDFDSNSQNVDFSAHIFSIETRQIRSGKMMAMIGVNDSFGKAIYVRCFENKALLPLDKIMGLKKGDNVRIRGAVDIDKFDSSLYVMGHFIDLLPPEEPRVDNALTKRVELHLHTKLSAMDGVSTIDDYCKVAHDMGHTAISITDHGCVQGFPDAQKAAKKYGLKMLYGAELYMIDTKLDYIMNPAPIELTAATYVVFDFETTGLSPRYDRAIEFGAVKVEKGMLTKRIDILINPGSEHSLSDKISKITNIKNADLIGKPTFKEVALKILDFIGDAILVSHNAQFDISFLNSELERINKPKITNPVIDTLPLSRYLFPDARAHRLGALASRLEVDYDTVRAHRADYDAEVLNNVWQAMIAKLTANNRSLSHEDLVHLETKPELYKHLRPVHVIALAKDEIGMKDLFKLISLSNIEFLAEVPKIPREVLMQYREHLLLGSACFNGEVFDMSRTRNEEDLKKAVSFYDYIEIQPPENYSYLIHMGELASKNDLFTYLHDIIKVAKEMGKMVVATGDCHYANPSDKIYRDVYIMAKGVGGVNHPLAPYDRERIPPFENPNQHYRSTEEMLTEFQADNFISEEEAIQYVVTNSNLIANSIKSLKPIKDKLYTPTIEHSEEMLKDICYKTAHEWYGDPLPEIVATRLSAELNGIISNGYSVIYYIAHKIIKKANDDGFMVGSRGSVGSSFVATMAHITEVNPLPPHYRCPHCQHSEFDPPEAKGVFSGYDLPEKNCPICGTKMISDGQNIPFATFLGFNADKVPDIDLNFPGDYQAQAHEYTKELLGAENVFKAGTIETVAEKTAFGYVRGFFERIGRDLSLVPKAEIAFLAAGCQDVKRTTGQHPGGIVVIPKEYEVYDFTPIQYPADNMDASWKTTHFDFHSIHDNVLKLDLLGHVDPMALKMMGDLTGINPIDIPMNDPKTLSIFSSPAALNLHSNYLQVTNGALAIPEFGTNFVRGLLDATKPKTFADLLIISGLSHGTDVWAGNAEKLIADGICDLRGVIGCRDDIMMYLSSMGVEPLLAFKIMEDVRKGRKVSAEYEKVMKEHNVPQYYIDSCNKIKYMFPKAHATAYVMMAIRVGWYKVYRPLEFYATFFTVRSKQYDLQAMIDGERAIIARLQEFQERKAGKGEPLSPKEGEIEKTLTIALEMVERGYRCENISLYDSLATAFKVNHEHKSIIPPFITVDGLGEAAAETVISERVKKPFLSIEDLVSRTKLNSQNIERLKELGVLNELPESNQINLFDFC